MTKMEINQFSVQVCYHVYIMFNKVKTKTLKLIELKEKIFIDIFFTNVSEFLKYLHEMASKSNNFTNNHQIESFSEPI